MYPELNASHKLSRFKPFVSNFSILHSPVPQLFTLDNLPAVVCGPVAWSPCDISSRFPEEAGITVTVTLLLLLTLTGGAVDHVHGNHCAVLHQVVQPFLISLIVLHFEDIDFLIHKILLFQVII